MQIGHCTCVKVFLIAYKSLIFTICNAYNEEQLYFMYQLHKHEVKYHRNIQLEKLSPQSTTLIFQDMKMTYVNTIKFNITFAGHYGRITMLF